MMIDTDVRSRIDFSIEFSIIVVTRNRNKELYKTLGSLRKLRHDNWEIVVVDNDSSQESKRDMRTMLSDMRFENLNLVELSENKGVAGGRNVGIKNARGKYLFFIDDDATIVDRDFLEKAAELFEKNPRIAIIACNITNTKDLKLQINRRFEVQTYDCVFSFVGAGHLIRNELFTSGKFPLYPDSLFYGMEEYYLSFLAYDLEMIVYLSFDLVILHSPSPNTRLSKSEIDMNNIVNKAVINTLLFPERYRRKIRVLMTFRLLKHMWSKPKCIFQAQKLYEKRCSENERDRKIKESTISFLRSVYTNMM